MGLIFNPKKAITAFSKSFIKTICINNGIDVESADAIASASAGVIEGFSYEKRKLPPNSKLYNLVMKCVGTSLKKSGIKTTKTLCEKIVDDVFSLDNLVARNAMELILEKAKSYLPNLDINLEFIMQEILMSIQNGIDVDSDLILLENRKKLDEILSILRRDASESTVVEFDDGSKFLIANYNEITWGKLALKDTYISNNYKFSISNSVNNDLLNLIQNFSNNDFNKFIQLKQISLEYNVRAMFIIGYQGIGKSSLLSKIAYEHEYNGYLLNMKTYYTSFMSICDGSFNIKLIKNDLKGERAIIFIDALDESDLTELEVVDMVNELIDVVSSFNGKLIITCRHNFININDIKMSFEISLLPFTEKQALEWIDKYNVINAGINIGRIENTLKGLKENDKNVVLIPYILYTCIEKNVNFEAITGLGKLYDILFKGVNALSAITVYNKIPRHSSKKWSFYERKIDELSITIYHADNYSISEKELKKIIGDENISVSHFATEFYLKKTGASYRFIHNSIFEYFIAKKIIACINDLQQDNDVECFLKQIDYIIGNIKAINYSILEFVSHCIPYEKSNINKINEIIISVLKSGTKIYFKISKNESIFEILEKLQNRFVIIMSIFVEYLKKYNKKSNLLQNLSEDEINLFIKYTQFNDNAFDFIKWFDLTDVNLKGINLSGTNLSGQLLNGLKLIDANLKNAKFVGAYLNNVNFSNSNMRNCDCKNADFEESILNNADLRNAKLSGANFYCADFMFADIRGAKLIKTNLIGANFFNCKISIDQLEFIHLDIILRYNINVYDGDKLLKVKEVRDYYKEKYQLRYMFNYSYDPLS